MRIFYQRLERQLDLLSSFRQLRDVGVAMRVRWEGRLLWLLIVAAAVTGVPFAAADLFLIGYLTGSQRRGGDQEYSRPGLSISGAISLAVDEINRQKPLRDNHTLDFIVAETYGEEAESILQTAILWTRNISVYIGPQETCVHEARMAASFNLPMLSYFCARFETSDKTYFPTFARTRPPDVQISKSVASVLLAFGWRRVAFLHSSDEDFEQIKIAEIITKTLEHCDIQVRFRKTWETTYHIGYLENPFLQLVEETYMDTRIYVILGQYYEHLALMVTMERKGLFNNGEYFVVGVDIEQYNEDNPRMYLQGLLKDEMEEVAKIAYQSYLGVMGSPPVGFDAFTVKVNDYMERPPFNFPNPLTFLGGMKILRAEAAYLYDAVHIYARALNETLANGEDPYDGRLIINRLLGQTYKSAMGFYVHMDENGDAEGNYTLVARKPIPNNPGEYGVYPIGVFQHIENGSIPVLRLTSSINWIGGSPPKDEPDCGFRGEKCISHTGEIAAGVTGGLLLTFIIVLLAVYRNWKYEQELDSLLWKIDFREIQINQPITTYVNGSKAFRSIHPVIRASQMSLMSSLDADFRYSNTMFTQTATYKGHIVAIRRVHKKNVDITRAMKKELKMMRDLRHDNLNSFVGACVDPPNICIVTEYCPRGSLRDVLENEDVKLDSMFIASLVGDILQGMIFLHESPIRSHGRLHSGNCLVDSRWVLKITDFGLHDFKADGEMKDDARDSQQKFENLLYTAPELLKDPNAPACGTQKGDVYSFGIILYEIHGRHGPYGQIEMTAEEIIKRIVNGSFLGTPFRPQLELLDNPGDCVRSCLRECWNENPDDRPDFKIIRQKLRPLRKGMRPNIFDNMIAMMEKYANNLEALVDEKAVQLVEEKKKTEALLYEMLPRYVAEQLKRGHKVEAESFDSVTIYFSDIVGFTAMSAESTPLEVVDFLNDLYTCFDSIIGSYDVYKVETIGDAYMVVSGLPIRNGDLHAGEIASMSLHLIAAVRRFKIRHRPHETLMLRVGIHAGPVCAGVVGLKMPRYCLFGDTVNTASRMESHGLPLKIHCSLQCKEILEKLGGYTLEERGIVKMKGKGDVRTYWLTGEDEKQREERLRLRSQRLKTIRACAEKHLSCCLPVKRLSFRKQAQIPPCLPDLSPSHFECKRELGGLSIPTNGDSQILKRSSWPRFGDVLDFPPEDGSSGRRGCSTATLFFAHEPSCDVPNNELILPLLARDNLPGNGCDLIPSENYELSNEQEPLLGENENETEILMKISTSLDYIDMETPV